MEKRDFIIVGQGLAGSILALELISRGKQILVIDNSFLSKCSKTAAGIYNPVVFKRLTQSWMAEKALPAMFDFFANAENTLDIKLLHKTKIARVLSTENEKDLWRKKAKNELSDFIEDKIKGPEGNYSFLQDAFAFVQQGGYVDVPVFLQTCREYLRTQKAIVEETFDHTQFFISDTELHYNNLKADKIIFCEGYLATQNPWFKDIKFKPAKGEALIIYCEELNISEVLNKDIFILPLSEKNYFKVGATYNWDELNDEPTQAGLAYLEEKLRDILPFSFRIVKQEAGVRPATIDRRPVIGFHPENERMGIFNGFGTKSVLLAPYFAKHFCSFMENKEELLYEVHVKRFFKLYAK